MLQKKIEWPSKVLQMETPYVFLSGFMNFQDNTFSIKVIYSFYIINKIQDYSGKFFERSSWDVSIDLKELQSLLN